MNHLFLNARVMLFVCLTLAAFATGNAAHAQMSYGEAYQKMWSEKPNLVNGSKRALYDKYFLPNPNVSPYLSGRVLGGNQYGDAYSQVVKPELDRRATIQTSQSQYIQQRKLSGNIGHTANPGVTTYGAPSDYRQGKPVAAARNNSGAYQNHWYGQWNK